MAKEKKEITTHTLAPYAKPVCKHNFIVTGWNIKGGNQHATSMRCSHCLMAACLEQLESQEWKDKNGI